MFNYLMFVFFAVLLLLNVIMLTTDGRSDLSRFLRHHLYDITPTMYITAAVLIWLVGLIAGDSNSTGIFAAQAVILLSCLVAYAGRFLARKSVRRKAKKLSPMKPMENTLKKLPRCRICKKAALSKERPELSAEGN
ncbi:MAG: hypothetical protein IKQ90_03420 [Ruminococcus sp.]|nr:hypothetical protein [Ruminococcus sp.]